jgi:pimeloyl-ACP methyl ester carboxylesterase
MKLRFGPVLVLSTVLAVAACSSSGGDDAAPAPETEPSTTTTPAVTSTTVAGDVIDERFDIGGGQELYLECQGEGSPTILLEAGDESGREDWASVMPSLVTETRTCAYDRAGTGDSDAATGCRQLDDLLDDTAALLDAAHIDGPFILVGASGGGYLSAGLAARRPADVAGLVFAEVPEAIVLADASPEVLDAVVCDAPSNVERRDYAAVEHAVWDNRQEIGDFPVVVISNDYGPDAADPGERTNAQAQRGWLVLSPNSHQVIVTSGHDVPINEPDLVVDEILGVLEDARG